LATAGGASKLGNHMPEDSRKRTPRGNGRTRRQDGLPPGETVREELTRTESKAKCMARDRKVLRQTKRLQWSLRPFSRISARTRSCRIVPDPPDWVARPGKSRPAAGCAGTTSSCAESMSNRVGQRSVAPAPALTRIFCACKGTHAHLLDVPVADSVTTTRILIPESTKSIPKLRLNKAPAGGMRGECES
jgi:hypothetical protein